MTNKSSRKRPQSPKGNRHMMEGFQELRKGSRAQPHRDHSKYTRKMKHKGGGWGE